MAIEAEENNSNASSLVTNPAQRPEDSGGLQSSEPPTPSQTPTPGPPNHTSSSTHQNFAPEAAALHLKLSQVKNFMEC